MNIFKCCLGGGGPPNPPPEPPSSVQGLVPDEITNQFNSTNLIAAREGNSCELFRCILPETNKVGAAKIYRPGEREVDLGRYLAETIMLPKANHPNVIKLIRRYHSDQMAVVVYEFMPYGSLDHHLFARTCTRKGPGLTQPTRVLDWGTRMRIAVGVAEGLVYVHTGLRKIHSDINVTNILLDEDLLPKLGNFGNVVNILYDENRREKQRDKDNDGNTINANSNLGYTAPEIEESGLVSTKSDVYSYGVLLLVLFTGREAFDIAGRGLTDSLIPCRSRLEDFARAVVDVALGTRIHPEGISEIFETAKKCTSNMPQERPDMVDVLSLVREAASYVATEEHQVKARSSVS